MHVVRVRFDRVLSSTSRQSSDTVVANAERGNRARSADTKKGISLTRTVPAVDRTAIKVSIVTRLKQTVRTEEQKRSFTALKGIALANNVSNIVLTFRNSSNSCVSDFTDLRTPCVLTRTRQKHNGVFFFFPFFNSHFLVSRTHAAAYLRVGIRRNTAAASSTHRNAISSNERVLFSPSTTTTTTVWFARNSAHAVKRSGFRPSNLFPRHTSVRNPRFFV